MTVDTSDATRIVSGLAEASAEFSLRPTPRADTDQQARWLLTELVAGAPGLMLVGPESATGSVVGRMLALMPPFGTETPTGVPAASVPPCVVGLDGHGATPAMLNTLIHRATGGRKLSNGRLLLVISNADELSKRMLDTLEHAAASGAAGDGGLTMLLAGSFDLGPACADAGLSHLAASLTTVLTIAPQQHDPLEGDNAAAYRCADLLCARLLTGATGQTLIGDDVDTAPVLHRLTASCLHARLWPVMILPGYTTRNLRLAIDQALEARPDAGFDLLLITVQVPMIEAAVLRELNLAAAAADRVRHSFRLLLLSPNPIVGLPALSGLPALLRATADIVEMVPPHAATLPPASAPEPVPELEPEPAPVLLHEPIEEHPPIAPWPWDAPETVDATPIEPAHAPDPEPEPATDLHHEPVEDHPPIASRPWDDVHAAVDTTPIEPAHAPDLEPEPATDLHHEPVEEHPPIASRPWDDVHAAVEATPTEPAHAPDLEPEPATDLHHEPVEEHPPIAPWPWDAQETVYATPIEPAHAPEPEPATALHDETVEDHPPMAPWHNEHETVDAPPIESAPVYHAVATHEPVAEAVHEFVPEAEYHPIDDADLAEAGMPQQAAHPALPPLPPLPRYLSAPPRQPAAAVRPATGLRWKTPLATAGLVAAAILAVVLFEQDQPATPTVVATSQPVAAPAPPPVAVRPPPVQTASIAKPAPAAIPAALPAPAPAPVVATTAASLLLMAQPGDTLSDLYQAVYRGSVAPPFATVASLNPDVRPGARLIFPAPAGGWFKAPATPAP